MICPKCNSENPEGAKFCARCGSSLFSESPEITYGGFWIRAAAFFIDLLIATSFGILLTILISLPFGFILGFARIGFGAAQTLGGIIGFLVGTATALIYHIGFLTKYGATPGKMTFGMRVVDENLEKIDWRKAALRETFGRFTSTISFGLGYFWVAIDKKKQGFHDKIAQTCVVLVKPLTKLQKIFAGLILAVLLLALIGSMVAVVFTVLYPEESIEEQMPSLPYQEEWEEVEPPGFPLTPSGKGVSFEDAIVLKDKDEAKEEKLVSHLRSYCGSDYQMINGYFEQYQGKTYFIVVVMCAGKAEMERVYFSFQEDPFRDHPFPLPEEP